MESQTNRLQNGSQTVSPRKTTSPKYSKDNSVGGLARRALNRSQIDRALPPPMTSEEFSAFSQQIENISLEEAKDHLQNLGPVPTLLDPVEVKNREIEHQEEKKNIRRDSVSFLKRRTSERKTNLAIPTLTITTESAESSSAPSTMSPQNVTSSATADAATSSGSSPTNVTSSDATATSLVSSGAISSGAKSATEGPSTQASHQQVGDGITSGSFGSHPTPNAEPEAVTRAREHERNRRAARRYFLLHTMRYTHGSRFEDLMRARSGTVVPNTAQTFWTSDPYASNNGVAPASAPRVLSSSGASLPVPPVVPSQNQPVSRDWLYGAPVRAPLVLASTSGASTPELEHGGSGSDTETGSGSRDAGNPGQHN